jgi:hypothetical protein
MVVTLVEPANVGLWIVLGILAVGGIVLAALGALMRHKRIPRKPIYWFAGFMALILTPQLFEHLVNAYMKSMRVNESLVLSSTLTADSSRNFRTLTHSTYRDERAPGCGRDAVRLDLATGRPANSAVVAMAHGMKSPPGVLFVYVGQSMISALLIGCDLKRRKL